MTTPSFTDGRERTRALCARLVETYGVPPNLADLLSRAELDLLDSSDGRAWRTVQSVRASIARSYPATAAVLGVTV